MNRLNPWFFLRPRPLYCFERARRREGKTASNDSQGSI